MISTIFKSLRSKFLVSLVIFVAILIPLSVARINNADAQNEQDALKELNEKISQYESEIAKLNAEANTLANQVAQYDAQIGLAELRIDQANDKIAKLGSRIYELEVSLESLSSAFYERVNKSYKLARLSNSYMMVVNASNLPDAVSSFHYLGRIQEADRNLLVQLEGAQIRYKEEKNEQETLQDELEKQQKFLENQKVAKSRLLQITRNDEKKYQSMLATARAERDAIQSIIAGKGKETEVRKISEGERIASVIPGASACSSGAHLHFEVAQNSVHKDPANYLGNRNVSWDNNPDSPFSFTGSWNWPLNDQIRVTQGYGMTYYAASLRYYGGSPHTGIDMVNNSDYSVKAVRPGILFQGGIACGGGTLKYVHVKQDDGLDTYYLHVNY